jgi:aspartate kinase
MMKRIRVLKFGGSSFRELLSYSSVADLLVSRLAHDAEKVVVVVSAMYGHTDQLLKAGLSISTKLSGEAADSLATTGEMISASLLRIALEGRHVPTTMLNGFQLGILSDSNFTRAKIKLVDPKPLQAALETNRAVVVTGAQAVDPSGRLTMLGRNSSDLTAIALAATLGLADCEILSDVPGVYSTDPNVFDDAQLLPLISHRQLIEMSRSGAKVIHYGAAEYAARHDVQIICRATDDAQEAGTTVRRDAPFTNVIVINEKSTLVQFASVPAARAAELELTSLGVEVLWTECPEGPVLAFAAGVLNVAQHIQQNHPAGVTLQDHGLLTVVHEAGAIDRLIVPRANLRGLAKKYHTSFYGEENRSGVSISGGTLIARMHMSTDGNKGPISNLAG